MRCVCSLTFFVLCLLPYPPLPPLATIACLVAWGRRLGDCWSFCGDCLDALVKFIFYLVLRCSMLRRIPPTKPTNKMERSCQSSSMPAHLHIFVELNCPTPVFWAARSLGQFSDCRRQWCLSLSCCVVESLPLPLPPIQPTTSPLLSK